MSRQINIAVLFIAFVSLLASSGDVFAAACTSAGSGNWSTITWTGCASGPQPADTVVIANTHTVTLDIASASIAGLTINTQWGAGTHGLTVGANTLTVNGSVSIAGNSNAGRYSTLSISTGTVNATGNIAFSGTAAQARLTFTGAGTLNLGGNLGTGGTFAASTGTVNCNGSSAQTAAGYTYNVLKSNNTAGVTLAAAATIATLTVGDVTTNSDFNDGGFQVTSKVTGTLNLVSGTFTLGSAGTATTMPAFATRNISAGTTIEYASVQPQNVAAITYANLSLSNNSTKTALGNLLVSGNLAINAGTFVGTTRVVTVNGNIYNAGTHTNTTTAGNITLSGGSSAHVLSGSGTYANLIMNDALGATLTGSPTVSGILTLTNGDISTGANTIEVSATCATGISGGSNSSYVVGNLRLHYPYPAGTTTCTFPIGDAASYTPATVAMTGVTSSLANSTLTAHTDTPDHADTTSGASGIDGTKSVNRTWTLIPGGSLVFGTDSITFNFVAGDIDSGASPANFIVGSKNGGTWTYPTIGTANPTSTAATGMAAFGEFAIGEPAVISGTVFEDINYSGGAGRNMTTSGGAAIANVLVEMYSNAGALLSSTRTNASGVYKFPRPSGTYTVRVVNASIASTRGCVVGTCLPVQTYRTNAGSGAAVAVTDHVGGENPAVADAGNSTLSGAQSITTVVKGAANVTGVDFGFNFDTIVSVRDAGQGSLRQFILNANALTGANTSIFMIPNGVANPGQNTGYANQLTTSGANSGAAVISLTSGVLPTITGDNTTLDGAKQTTNVGDTNPGWVGTGGTVGTMAKTLPWFNRPEVVISAAATQLTGSGASVVIKGLAIANGGISVSGNSSQVVDCLSGMNADGTVSTVYGGAYGISIGAGTGILIRHNYVKINNSGIRSDSAVANLIIEYNEVDAPNNTNTPGGGHTGTFDGILIVGTASTSNVTIQYNLTKNQRGGGLEYGFNGGTVISGTAQGNTILNNGSSGGTRSAEPVGVAIWQLSAGSNLTIKQNVITGNAGSGVIVISASGVIITQNSIYANGTLATDTGINLNSLSGDPNTYTAQGVTLNDLNDPDTGPNGLLNFPVIESATISGSNLILKGWARPGSVIEFFLAATDASGFGSGKTYLTPLTPLTEGSAADTDTTSSTYGPGAINGVAQGTDNTNRFQFTIALPGGVALGTVLTATATLGGNTSEFSGNVTVSGLPLLTVTKTTSPVITSINPGQPVTYTSVITNSGAGTATNVELTDTLSPYTAWGVNSFGAGIAFQFVDGPVYGGAASGLTLTLGTPVYSNDKGVSWSYSPSSTGGGAPGGYDANVTNWKIPMTGTMNGWPGGGNPKPGFTINYKVLAR